MSKRFPLNILDEYAKTLSAKQVKMLYESKNKKKMTKALFEAVVPDTNVIQYEFWIDRYVIVEYLESDLTETGMILREFTNSLEAGQYSFNVNDEGIAFKTSDPAIYDEYVSYVEDTFDELPPQVLNSLIDQRFFDNN